MRLGRSDSPRAWLMRAVDASTVMGAPLRTELVPDSCHPPIHLFPLATGTGHEKAKVKIWVRSQSDRARSSLRFLESRAWEKPPADAPVSWEASSMDLLKL